jgi:hypothetical protein
MAAANDEGRPYPFDSRDIFGGTPAEIVATLEANRGNWPPSGRALYEAAIPAAAARVKKDRQIQDANWRLIDAWQAGELRLYGLNDQSRQFELIPRSVVYVDGEIEDADIEMRGSDMYRQPAGSPPGFSQSPIYRAVVVERRALIEWASRSGVNMNTEAEGAPPFGEGTVPVSPEEGPPQQTNADTEQAPANTEAPIDTDIAGRGSTDSPESAVPIRTGVAGRPTSKHIIVAEAERRLAAGDVPENGTAFVKELVEWFVGMQKGRRPEDRAPVPSVRTLETPLRQVLRKYGIIARKIAP